VDSDDWLPSQLWWWYHWDFNRKKENSSAIDLNANG
jgi:hypothetical protein